MAKSTALVEMRLSKVIPKATLELQKKEIETVVKNTDSGELHTIFTKAKGFFKLFEAAVKGEFVKRVGSKANKGRIVTDVGSITLVERSNFSYDFDGIDKFLKAKKINEELAYDYEYSVNTKNAKILVGLVDKGYISLKKKINGGKLNELADSYPEILDFIDNNPTRYVKGL